MTQDIRIGLDNDLYITSDGDFDISPSDSVHIEHILMAKKGHYRFFPLCGADISAAANMPMSRGEIGAVTRRVELQLRLDGYDVAGVTPYMSSNQLLFNINAERR